MLLCSECQPRAGTAATRTRGLLTELSRPQLALPWHRRAGVCPCCPSGTGRELPYQMSSCMGGAVRGTRGPERVTEHKQPVRFVLKPTSNTTSAPSEVFIPTLHCPDCDVALGTHVSVSPRARLEKAKERLLIELPGKQEVCEVFKKSHRVETFQLALTCPSGTQSSKPCVQPLPRALTLLQGGL